MPANPEASRLKELLIISCLHYLPSSNHIKKKKNNQQSVEQQDVELKFNYLLP